MVLGSAIRNEHVDRTIEWESLGKWLQELFFNGEEPEVNLRTAEGLSPIAAAHRIFTNSMSVLPLGIYQKKDDARHPVTDKNLDWLLKIRSNDLMSPAMVRKVQASQAFWYGRGHVWPKRKADGTVEALIPLMTSDVSIRKDLATGAVWYDCTVNGLRRTFAPSELITVFFETYDGLNGRGVLDMAREAIATDAAIQRYAKKFYCNGAKMSGVISVETDLEKEGRDRIKNEFRRYAKGDDEFAVAVLDRGMTYTPIGLSQSNAQFIESRAFSVAEVSRFTGIPEFMLQSGKQAYNSNAQQQLHFVTNTLLPHVVHWEQEYGYRLLSKHQLTDGWYMKFNLAALLRGDDGARAKFYQLMVYTGIYSPNECRAFEEMNPIPGGLGEKFFMTKNLAPLEEIVNGGVKNG